MLCLITKGWFSGNSSLCGIHLLYVVWFWSVHWHRYVLYFFVILYLSFVSFVLWFIIVMYGKFYWVVFYVGRWVWLLWLLW